MKLTQWFPGHVKPVRVGVYERDYGASSPLYSYWNGRYWAEGFIRPRDAMRFRNYQSAWQSTRWRGVEK